MFGCFDPVKKMIIKINNFRGELSDISAKKATLVTYVWDNSWAWYIFSKSSWHLQELATCGGSGYCCCRTSPRLLFASCHESSPSGDTLPKNEQPIKYTGMFRFIGLRYVGNSILRPFSWEPETYVLVFCDQFSRNSCWNSVNRSFLGNRPFR